jgi:hypothetical protein
MKKIRVGEYKTNDLPETHHGEVDNNESDDESDDDKQVKKVKRESENTRKHFGFYRSGSFNILKSPSMESMNGPFDFLPQEALVSIFMCLPPMVIT